MSPDAGSLQMLLARDGERDDGPTRLIRGDVPAPRFSIEGLPAGRSGQEPSPPENLSAQPCEIGVGRGVVGY